MLPLTDLFRPGFEGAHHGRASHRLNRHHPRTRDPQLLETLMDGREERARTYRNQHPVRHPFSELLEELVCDGLVAFEHVGIDVGRRQVGPAVTLRCCPRQCIRVAVVAPHADDPGPDGLDLDHLGRGRSLRHHAYRRETGPSSVGRNRHARVARGGAEKTGEAKFPGHGRRDGHRPVLEGARWVHGLVLQQHPFGRIEPPGPEQGCVPFAERHGFRVRGDREEAPVAPDPLVYHVVRGLVGSRVSDDQGRAARRAGVEVGDLPAPGAAVAGQACPYGGSLSRRAHCYFSAPAVRPSTKYRPMKAKITITGTAVATAAAVRIPQSMLYCWIKAPKPTGRVFFPSSTMKAEANMYSVQDHTNEKMAAAAMPGAVSGSTMEKRMRILPAPSRAAAASIPAGIAPKKPRISQTLKGAVKVTLTITRLRRLLMSPTLPIS